MRRPTRTLLAGLLLGSVLIAASASVAEPKPATPPDRLALNRIGLPVVWRGRLVNYVFVEARLKLAPGRSVEALRAKEPYLRDALIRAAHRTPFTDSADLTRVDERAVDAALLREAGRILGSGAAVAAEVTSQQPRRRTGLPRTGGEPAPAGRQIVP